MLKPRLSIQQERATGHYLLQDLTGVYHATKNIGGWGAPNTPIGDATAQLVFYAPLDGSTVARFDLPASLLTGTEIDLPLHLHDGSYLAEYRITSRIGVPLKKCSYKLSVANPTPAGKKLLVGRKTEGSAAVIWVDATAQSTTLDGVTTWASNATTNLFCLYRLTLADGVTIEKEGEILCFDCFTSGIDSSTTATPQLVGSYVEGLLVDGHLRDKMGAVAQTLTDCVFGTAPQDFDARHDAWALVWYEWQELRLIASTISPGAIIYKLNRLHRQADKLQTRRC